MNIISQRKSVSTPDISNEEPTFAISTTEQASSADNIFPLSDTIDHVSDVNLYFIEFKHCFLHLAYGWSF